MHFELIAVFGGSTNLVKVREVNLRVDSLTEQVDAERDEVDVAGPFTVAKQASLDAVGAGHVPQLGRGDCGSAVIVGVQRDDDVLAVIDVSAHPLDTVRVHVRRCHLDRCGQVNDDFTFGGRLQDLKDLVAHVDGEFEFGSRVGLGAVLVEDIRAGQFIFEGQTEAGRVTRDIDDSLLVGLEHDIPLQRARGVVEVDNCVLRALERFICATDEVLARLGEDLNGHIVGDESFLDNRAHEVEVSL